MEAYHDFKERFRSLELNDDCDYSCHSSLILNADKDETSSWHTFKIFLDRNTPVDTMKRLLSSSLHIPIDSFKILRRRNDAMRDTEKVSFYDEGEELKIVFESMANGVGANQDEFKVKIFFLKLSELEEESKKLDSVFDCVLDKNTSVASAKSILVEILRRNNSDKYKDLNALNCRLWKKDAKQSWKVFSDNENLTFESENDECEVSQRYFAENSITNHYLQIVLQDCEGKALVNPPENSLVIFVRRWNPITSKLGPIQEILLDGKFFAFSLYFIVLHFSLISR